MRLRLFLTSLVVLAVTVSSFTYSTFAKWTSTPVTFWVRNRPLMVQLRDMPALSKFSDGIKFYPAAVSGPRHTRMARAYFSLQSRRFE